MMHLHIPFLYQSHEDDLPLQCGCSLRFNEEDPFFLVPSNFSQQHQDLYHFLPDQRPLGHSKSIANHHVINKMSLRREKEKTSIKLSECTRCSLSNTNHKKNLQGQSGRGVIGSCCQSSQKNMQCRSQMPNWHFSALNLEQNHLYYAQNQATTVERNPKGTEVRDQTRPNIKFTVGGSHPTLAHSQSEKTIPNSYSAHRITNTQKFIVHIESNRKSNVESEQEIGCKDLRRKKELKTKQSYQTHCSESSIVRQILDKTSKDQAKQSKIAKQSLIKKGNKGHKRFNTMSDLCEVKSVVDESDCSSDKQSIVLGRLQDSIGTGLFDELLNSRHI